MRSFLISARFAPVGWLLNPFSAPFMQRALAEVVLLGLAGGALGAWVVMRRLAFYTHAVGTATFPGLVVAGPWGIAPELAALGASATFAGGFGWLSRSRRLAPDTATAVALVGALALGSVLASDVYHSGAAVDRLLFGTLIGLTVSDVRVAAAVAVISLLASAAFGRVWLARCFDTAGAAASGPGAKLADGVLLGVLGAAIVGSLAAVGALLVSALFVTPAATARMLAPSVRSLQAGAAGLAMAEGALGLWIAYRLDVPPGPAIAVLGGAVFALVAVVVSVRDRSLAP